MRLIATFFYVGLLRPAPGTWGSLAALPVAYALLLAGGFWLLLAATVAVFVLGWIATDRVTAGMVNHDPSWIVIDEVAGQWIALFPVAYGAAMMSVEPWRLWPGWISAFVVFRLFDIWKPGPVGWADRQGGAMGVMLDDAIAGVFAAVVTILLAGLAHGVLM
ncbi:MAG TPA: phosphatidylglycerophosphatase A [Citreicella sp.]|mgnify:FL=1|jgi:phosphatidylglycerophosphatase A|uniref:Phosphatidylglycerophosphatase A n=1 Tax=Salipiger marinus TaxID=555512 RepID=A0A1G8PPI3_9RHOB|nr:phosphatidylglycerophosphatase A [Salipiger marinus]SDI93750.1 phosphatidylglycerophosphatase A [Salipiger marinus]HBM58323.1 phosphatidylglycerophosphatase A [Citreicella sp.]HBT00159.1 phosphatidylglycerophosphatase A [Citreicella sp.]